MTCKYKVKIKDIQYNYKVQMTDIQSKYKFKVFCTGYDDSEIKEKIDAMYQAWPKVSGEGETITLNDTVNTTMAIDLKGNTSQETTTGKNLFNVNSVTSVTNGSISNEIITTNETSDSTYSLFPYFSNISLPANTYYLSMDIRIKSGTGYFNKINDAVTDWTAVSKPSLSTTFQRYVYSHTYTSVTTLNHILIQFISSTNAVYEITNIMLSTSSDTNFEKYTGGNPAPNPDYPQEIHVVSGKSNVKVVGKNKLPFPYTQASSTMYGVTFTVQNDGSVLVNGTANGGNANIKLYGNYSEANNKELMGRYVSGGTNEVRLRVLNNTNNSYTLLANDTGNGAEINTSTYKKGYIELTVLNGTTVNNELIKPMMLNSLDDTAYEPYQEQSFDLDLPFELCKIGDYKDRIYPLNEKWYLEKFSEKVTIDGTNIAVTNRRETNTSGNYSFIFLFSKKAKRADGTITQGGYCNKLVSKPRNNIYGRTQGFGYGATNNDYWGDIVIFRTDWATKTITDVNTDLKSNPIELEYLLDSAETIEITDSTLISQLEEIKEAESYLGQTNISQTNDDKPFILTATALKDLSSL